MSSPATTIRSALATIITAEFPDLAFVGGVRSDRMHASLGLDGNYCATYPTGEVERPGNALVQDTTVMVQMFGQWTKEVDPAQAVDPAIVESWANRLKRAVNAASQAPAQMVWYFRVTGVDYPPDPTGNISRLVATVTAYGNNPATTETIA